MKTRYKIFLVITCYVSFYFAIIPVLQYCLELDADCTVWQELMLLTRPVISSGGGIIEWSGTPEGIEESPPITDMILMNMPFIFSMVVLPCTVIGVIVLWDKRK